MFSRRELLVRAALAAGSVGVAGVARADTSGLESYVKGEPLRIGTARQLLVDDYLVEDRFGVERRQRQPLKYPKNPVMTADRPWEPMGVWYPDVLYDAERKVFRMWYVSGNVEAWYYQLGGAGRARWNPALHGYPAFLCYAESADGIHWEKPPLGLVAYRDQTKTNIVYTGNCFSGAHQVIVDPRESDPQRRYKLIYDDLEPKRGTYIACSPDGLRWTRCHTESLMPGHYDNPKPIVWDDANRRWIMITRPPIWALKDYGLMGAVARKGRSIRRSPRRKVAVSVSEDLLHWSFPRTLFAADETDLALGMSEFDNMWIWKYHGLYLGFLAEYQPDGNGGAIKLAFSRDGLRWQQLPDRPVYIARGRDGEFDGGFVAAGTTNIVEFGGKWWQYYGGYSRADEMSEYETGIGLVRMHPEGLVEQQAGADGGFLLTREFVLEGDRLEVNCVLHNPTGDNGGSIQVEVLTRPGPGSPAVWERPGLEVSGYDLLPGRGLQDCDAIAGNFPHAVVSWKGNPDLGPWRGKAVYLRFFLRNAGLYGFQIADSRAAR
jgi:hypothetical protein